MAYIINQLYGDFHPSTCGRLTGHRNKPQQRQTCRHLAVVYWELVSLLMELSIHSENCSLTYSSVRKWRVLEKQVTYLTGYWETDHNVTRGQLHFIGPANSHTHALPVHRCITGLSLLVCFSKVGFAHRVKSQLRQWTHGGH